MSDQTYWYEIDGQRHTFVEDVDDMETEDILVYYAWRTPDGHLGLAGKLRGETFDGWNEHDCPEGTEIDGPWFPWEREVTNHG